MHTCVCGTHTHGGRRRPGAADGARVVWIADGAARRGVALTAFVCVLRGGARQRGSKLNSKQRQARVAQKIKAFVEKKAAGKA